MPKAHPDSRTYRVIALILRPLLFAVTKPDWHGAENMPAEGGFIAAVNHITNVDPVTTAHYLYDNGRAPKIMAKVSLWKVPVLGFVMRHTGQVPVERGSLGAAKSLDDATERLHEGECVVVFPEGTLTREPNLWPMKGKTGVARLALASRVPVIPIAQWGAQNLLARYGRVFHVLPPRKQLTVVAGPPVDLSDLYDRPPDAALLREATERVMAAITALLEEVRGERASAERFDMAKHPGSRDKPKPAKKPERGKRP